MLLSSRPTFYNPGRKLCLDLLRHGYRDTFIEIFNLIQTSRELRNEAAQKRSRHLPELLENQLNLLKAISGALAKAEKDSSQEYELRFCLGHLFTMHKNTFWLAEYFYRSSYNVIDRTDVEGGRKMIQALERLGFIKECEGCVQEALKLLEEAFQLADEYGLEMTDVVRQALYLITHRISMTLGLEAWDEERTEGDVEHLDPRTSKAFTFFKKAAEMATFANTKESQAISHAKMGEVMLHLGKHDSAIRHFKLFLSFCRECGDRMGQCNGYLALSTTYQNKGDTKFALKMLRHCQDIALAHDLYPAMVPCCIEFGKILTDQGDFGAAFLHFQTAFRIMKNHKDCFKDVSEVEKLVRVLCGVARAHVQMKAFIDTVNENTPSSLVKLVRWKTSAVGFGDTLVQSDYEVPV